MMTFKVPGMSCGGCAGKIRTLLGAVEGVEEVRADVAAREVHVAGPAAASTVRAALERAGWDVEAAA